LQITYIKNYSAYALFFNATYVEIQMKLLNLENCQQVSGGDVDVTVTANIPTDQTGQFLNLLGMLLTNQLNAKVLSYVIDTAQPSFNDMPIEKIVVGNFVITRA